MSFILRKIAFAVLTVAGSVTLVFLLVHLIPGDPVDNLLGEQALELDRARLRHAMRLDMPLHVQFGAFLKDVASGTLGMSYFKEGATVSSLIAGRFPRTLALGVFSMLLAVLFAVPLGVFAAVNRGGPWDAAAVVFSMAGLSLPAFFIGPALLLVFCRWLGWFAPPAADAGLHGMLLPSVTLGLGMAALLARMTRASMLEVLGQDFILAARAKGLSPAAVHFRHALKNALPPVLTVAGMQFGALLAGAVITERVFAWPGMGSLMIEAVEKRDFPVVQGCILVISACYVAVNLFTDLACAAVDPRIRDEA
jgi:peptide/nickel transport system permease protein